MTLVRKAQEMCTPPCVRIGLATNGLAGLGVQCSLKDVFKVFLSRPGEIVTAGEHLDDRWLIGMLFAGSPSTQDEREAEELYVMQGPVHPIL